jgi:hypothetical protein
MSFGSPSSDLSHGEYVGVFTHTNGQMLELRSMFIAGPGDLDPGDMDTAWAAAVALLDASADIDFNGGQKTYSTTETYTL